MGNFPKRRKGTEKVTTFGLTSRMTMTSSGFGGTSLDDMLSWSLVFVRGSEANAAAPVVRRTVPVMSFRLVDGRRCEGLDDVLMVLVGWE